MHKLYSDTMQWRVQPPILHKFQANGYSSSETDWHWGLAQIAQIYIGIYVKRVTKTNFLKLIFTRLNLNQLIEVVPDLLLQKY
jgi:hypothetical protein